MTETQKELLKLILEIDQLCKKHDIQYFLEFGSALGGLRHHGYIPWDNDMDIVMKEDDYNKFREICSQELDQTTRTFVDNRIDREYPSVFGHYVNLETCRMDKFTDFWKNHCGQTIDVFCMFELPGDPEERMNVINFFYAYDEFANRSFLHYKRNTDRINELYKSFQEREKEIGFEETCRELDKKVFGHHYPDGDMYMMGSARFGGTTPFVPRSAYEKVRLVEFEGHLLPIPGDAVETLIMYYGDDFSVLPEDKRIHSEMSHKGIPSQVYVDDFLSNLDKEELLKHRKRFKELGMKNGLEQEHLKQKFHMLKGRQIKKELYSRIEKNGVDVFRLMESGKQEDIALLNDLFEEFLKWQLNKRSLYWRYHFGLSDQLDEVAIYTLYKARADFTGVDRYLRLRWELNMEPTARMKQIQNEIAHFRNIRKYMIYNDLEKAETHLEWCKQNCPDIDGLGLQELLLLTAKAKTSEEIKQCEAFAQQLDCPQNQYYRKAIADLLLKKGQTKQALHEYQDLKESANDGFILMDISRIEKEYGGIDQ